MTRNPISGLLGGAALLVAVTAAPAFAQQGSIEIDGSSTVGPITAAVQREFKAEYPGVDVTVNVSGTGGGFKRFVKGQTDISNASRPIKPAEAELAGASVDDDGNPKPVVEFIEVPVAYDGLTIVINNANDWATELTVDDLKKIFLDSPDKAKVWSDVNPAWPSTPIKLFSPGTDSGTFDYFKEVVAGKTGSIRSDMSVSEDDNVLVRGVVGDKGAIGFFGCSYYFENEGKLTAVAIKNDAGDAVLPGPETIESGEYNPFSRPLFIYIKADALDRPEVAAFVDFYLDVGPELAEEVGYVRLPDAVYDVAERKVEQRETGSVMSGAHGSITKLYQ